jgi:hypothetical protein
MLIARANGALIVLKRLLSAVSRVNNQKGDSTAIETRQFLLGKDFIFSDFVGTMGFDEVTDWEYYYQSEGVKDEQQDRKVVSPNPMDESKP